MHAHGERISSVYRSTFKRWFDLLASIGLFAALSPVMVIVSTIVFISMGRPILFKQRRPGLGGHVFTLWKFRTMRVASLAGTGSISTTDEVRLTRLGRILRNWSLDELPSLWNVVRGDMSLVGPRPLLVDYLSRYDQTQARRHEVRPGLTGWAQVNGRNQTDWQQRLRQDVWYVDNLSFLLDVRILWLTVKRVLMREGVSTLAGTTMPEFRGEIAERSVDGHR